MGNNELNARDIKAGGDVVAGAKIENHYYANAPAAPGGAGIAPLAKALQPLLQQYFGLADMQGLEFDLGITPDMVAGATLPERARNLTVYCQRYGLLEALRAAMEGSRPHLQPRLQALRGLAHQPAVTNPTQPEVAAPGKEQSNMGIKAKTIEARRVVDGVLQEGGSAADAEALAGAASKLGGGIEADLIKADTVARGYMYIADPATATADQLQKEVAALCKQLDAILAASDVPIKVRRTVEDAADDLKKVDAAIGEKDGGRAQDKLGSASTALKKMGDVVGNASTLGTKLAGLAGAVGGLVTIASKIFG